MNYQLTNWEVTRRFRQKRKRSTDHVLSGAARRALSGKSPAGRELLRGLKHFSKMNAPQIGSGNRSALCGDTHNVHICPVVVKYRAHERKGGGEWRIRHLPTNLLDQIAEDAGSIAGFSGIGAQGNLCIPRQPSSSAFGLVGNLSVPRTVSFPPGRHFSYNPSKEDKLMPKKCETSSGRMASLAGKTLANPKSPAVARRLAASVLTQAPNKTSKRK